MGSPAIGRTAEENGFGSPAIGPDVRGLAQSGFQSAGNREVVAGSSFPAAGSIVKKFGVLSSEFGAIE